MNDKYEALKLKVDSYLLQSSTKNEIKDYILSINSFKSIEDWENIIRLMFYVEDIPKSYPDKIVDKINLGKKKYGENKVNEFLIPYLKEESDSEKDYSNFFYQLHQQFKNQEEELISHNDLLTICNRRFERYLANGKNINIAFTLFYSCWDSVDKKNIVHITNQALKLMRAFIDKVPEDYLKFIIRPKYSPPTARLDGDFFSFVFEPFTDKIFSDWDTFREFLKKCEGKVDQQILKGINQLFIEYASNGYRFIPVPEESIDKYGSLIRKWISKV